MRVSDPPRATFKEISHMRVAFKHQHVVIAATRNPAAVPGDIRAFARSLIAAGHAHFPGETPAIISYSRRPFAAFTPRKGIMIFVTVLFIHLRNGTAGFCLFQSVLQHEIVATMFVPTLEHGEVGPGRSAESEGLVSM